MVESSHFRFCLEIFPLDLRSIYTCHKHIIVDHRHGHTLEAFFAYVVLACCVNR